MSEDAELLGEPEKARIRSRDRKIRGPRVVVDNPGLRKLTMALADRRRRPKKPEPPAGGG